LAGLLVTLKGLERSKSTAQNGLFGETHDYQKAKKLALSANLVEVEKKRPGRREVMLKKSIEKHHGDNGLD